MLFVQLFMYAAAASALCRPRKGQSFGSQAKLNQVKASPALGNPTAPSPAASPLSKVAGGSSLESTPFTGGGISASFTEYSGCSSTSVSCGTLPGGHTAAISENYFGAGPGDGAGPACGQCWTLSSPTAGTTSINVTINNLCPIQGNEAMCGQTDKSATNSVGMNINFDLCIDDKTAATFFGNTPRMTTGTAVPC